MRWRGGFVVACMASAVVACTSFSAKSTEDDAGVAATDGGEAGPAPAVTGEAPPDAGPPNLLKDGTFDTSCTAWKPDGLSVTWEPSMARGNTAGACKVCFLGDNAPSASLTQNATFASGPNRQLAAAVFLRAESAAPALQGDISSSIVDEGGLGGGAVGPTLDITPTDWVQFTLPRFDTMDGDGAQLKLVVFAADPVGSPGTACFFVDDATVHFVP